MESTISLIYQLEKKQVINKADIEFAYVWLKLDPDMKANQLLIFLASLHFQEKGHVALDQEMLVVFLDFIGIRKEIDIKKELENSTLTGSPEDYKPFIFFDGLLYQHKSFTQENELANWLISKSNTQLIVEENLGSIIDQNYSQFDGDFQKIAIYKSFSHSILFITGGPGTGKTYTVKQLIESHRSIFGESYSIKIAAPTGKAAQRINDSLNIEGTSTIKAVTIHQLLGASDILGGFRFNNRNHLLADLIIVDEASMMDLSLWSALTKAISTNTRLIIVGDPFQLASVESGSVLSDICSVNSEVDSSLSGIEESIIKLEKRHRFSEDSGIHKFAHAINTMDVQAAIESLSDSSFVDLQWVELTSVNIFEILSKYAIDPVIANNESKILEYRLLSPLRNGPFGCNYLNRLVETEIKRKTNVSLLKLWFRNRVIMANKNDYRLGIQNGEIGIYDEETAEVNFSNQKKIPIGLIKNYESAYCITIHKSQGSEYDHVAIILPEHKNSILTKELLYTAVTRARKSVLVIGNKKILTHCISHKTKRKSGLKKQLSSLLVNSGS